MVGFDFLRYRSACPYVVVVLATRGDTAFALIERLTSDRYTLAVKDIKRAQQLVLDNEINLLLSVGGGSPIDSVKVSPTLVSHSHQAS